MSDWISVDKALPETGVNVLIQQKWTDTLQIGWYTGKHFVELHEDHVCHGDAMCTFEIDDVSHWQPLPPPPE